MSDNDALPKGWVATRVMDICAIVGGGTPSTHNESYWQGAIPWITSADIDDIKDVRPRKAITEQAIVESATNVVPAGSVIVVTRVGLGKVALAPEPLCFSQDSQGLLFDQEAIDPLYLAYCLKSAVQVFKHISRGTTISGVTKKQLQELPVLLPPLAEQRRIVQKIEELFARLEAGVAALERVRANLRRYRAAVLKAAVEGQLTEEWRAAHPADEPAPALLQRILRERRAAWEQAESDRFAKAGKAPPKGWQSKYKEPKGPDTSNLPELPEGWCWATPQQLAAAIDYSLAIGPFGSNLKVEDYRSGGVPLVFVRNIRSGVFNGPDTRFITHEKADELQAHRVVFGDILITKMGDPPGDACLYPDSRPPAVITADCIKWTLSPTLQQRRYFVHAINSQLVKRFILDITQGVAQLKVSLGRFERIAVPLAPLAEQEQIVAEVERRLSVVVEVERQVEAGLKRAARLRQSILARAFAGKLVPQDPADEPAGALLERIRAAGLRDAGAERRGPVPNGKERAGQRRDTRQEREAFQLPLALQ